MKYISWLASLAVIAIIVSGCGKNDTSISDTNSVVPNGQTTDQSVPVTATATLDETPVSTVPAVKEFSMIAKNWEFTPSTITVNQGDQVRLKVKSIDVEHGLAIPDYNINVKLTPNKEEIVEFTADKVGTFNMRCSVMCGAGHKTMTGQLIVQ